MTDDVESVVAGLFAAREPHAVEPETASEPEEIQEPDAEEQHEDTAGDVAEVETSDDDEPEQDEPEAVAPSKYTVKVDGKDIDVTLDDLKRSFSGQSYIQKGMQEAAAAKKEATALYETLRTEQERFAAVVEQLQKVGFKAPPQAPDIALMDKDPIGYMRAEAQYRQDAAAYSQQVQMTEAVKAQQQRLTDAAKAEYLKEQAKVLQERIPDFADAKKAGEIKQKLVKTGMDAYGFSADELSGIVDARHVQVLHDAMKWRELQAVKATAPKAQEPPRNVKPAARREGTDKLSKAKAYSRVAKTGNLNDFLDAAFKANARK